MKMYLISDNTDTLTGLRLAGIEGEIARSLDELKTAMARALDDKNIAIILISESFQEKYSDYINSVKLAHKQPLFVDIPGRYGSGRKADFISKHIKEAIGLKL